VNSREIVMRTIRFQGAERFPYMLDSAHGTDFAWCGMDPSPDWRPRSGVDEWGCVWENIGVSNLGEVKEFPLKDWADWETFKVPDIRDPRRWENLRSAREAAGERFLLGSGISLYERAHFVRGLENLWTDIHQHPEELGRLLDVLVEMNLYAIEQYARLGVDGYIFADDWGFQQGLMISPRSWRALWKPRYTRVFQAACDAGLATFLHSCGDISAILDDLIDAGLQVIEMHQQENMGMEQLGERFRGLITFMCPVDIQKTMVNGTMDEIREYCGRLVHTLGLPEGGFIAEWYSDPIGAGHRPEAIRVMCDEFVRLSCEAWLNSQS
jgi:hypothetical protein